MRLEILPSDIELKQVVSHFWILEIQKEDLPFSQPIIPFSWHELVIDLNDEKGSMFTGFLNEPSSVIFSKPYSAVGVCFQPWAGKFIDKCIPELVGRTSSLEFNAELKTLSERSIGKNHQDVLGRLKKYISQKMYSFQFDYLAKDIVSYVDSSLDHSKSMYEFGQFGYSQRRIQQRFKETTGVTISSLIRRRRFEKSLKLISASGFDSLTSTAYCAGYYDQSHFIREFKNFTGLVPKDFVHQISTMDEEHFKLTVT